MTNIMKYILPDKDETLKKLHQSFITGINNFKATVPRDFLDSIGLDYQKLHLGFNSGQFHHRKDEEFKKPYIKLGVLTKSDAPTREPGMIGYSTFGDYGIIFPLKDEVGNIVNMYSYRFKIQTPIGEYLNDSGIYPAFPNHRTTRLFLTENVIDGATLHQSEVLENRDSVIALNNGKLTADIKKGIEQLAELTHIIVVTSNENNVLTNELKRLTTANVTIHEIPEQDSINDFYLTYGNEGLLKFIDELDDTEDVTKFQVISDKHFYYKGQDVSYHIYSAISQNSTLMEFDFEIEVDSDQDVLKAKLDLLNEKQTNEELYFWTENKNLNYSMIVLELVEIKSQLEKVRQSQFKNSKERGFSTKQDKLAKQLLRSNNLFDELNELIGKAGVIGEEKSRLLLYMIASSYKFPYNLHAVVHSDDITTASELVSTIAQLIPECEQYLIDLTTSRSFRYYGNSAIDNKLVVIPDYSGVTSSRSISDLKRLQAKGNIINDTPIKGANGFLNTVKQTVNGHCSSIGACTNSKKYFEGEPRTVLVSMDNSIDQIQRLMEYDCLLMAGQVDLKAQEQAKELLQYIIRNIHSLGVVNPHAMALMLPNTIRNARMLTMQLTQFVSMVALFKQHQRDKDNQGRVIATIEDNQTGINLFLDALMLNIDELDSSTRDFFDKLKVLMMNESSKEKTKLSSLTIQKALGLSKSHANRFLSNLVSHEYVKQEGYRNTGYTYMVSNWDELSSIKQMIQNKLGGSCDPNTHGSPESL
jgi:DNA primase